MTASLLNLLRIDTSDDAFIAARKAEREAQTNYFETHTDEAMETWVEASSKVSLILDARQIARSQQVAS